MKKIFFVIFILVSLVIINNLIHSVYTTWEKKDLIAVAQKNLEKEKEENLRLKSQLSVINSEQFVEKEARDKLFLVKPGEQKVLMPEDSNLKTQDKKYSQIPNWQQWWNLFF